MDKSDNAAGKAVGQTEDKGLMDKAGSVAISARESAIGAGKVVQTKAQEAVGYVKDAVTPAPKK